MSAGAVFRLSTRLALFFSLLLAIIEVAYNWNNPSWWPFILVDYIAAGLLLWGALSQSRVVLAAGWGFSCAMFYMAWFLTVREGKASAFIVVGMGILFAITIVGLALTLMPRRNPFQ